MSTKKKPPLSPQRKRLGSSDCCAFWRPIQELPAISLLLQQRLRRPGSHEAPIPPRLVLLAARPALDRDVSRLLALALGALLRLRQAADGAARGRGIRYTLSRRSKVTGKPQPVLPRFEALYTLEPNSRCWLWLGHLNNNGYGHFCWNNKQHLAHRFSVLYSGRVIPTGMHVDHLCSVRRCVNPDHLEVVTQAENNRRSARLRTHCSRGHSMENPILAVGGTVRYCRTCYEARQSAYNARRRLGMTAANER